jgi:hypothetical protein
VEKSDLEIEVENQNALVAELQSQIESYTSQVTSLQEQYSAL